MYPFAPRLNVLPVHIYAITKPARAARPAAAAHWIEDAAFEVACADVEAVLVAAADVKADVASDFVAVLITDVAFVAPVTDSVFDTFMVSPVETVAFLPVPLLVSMPIVKVGTAVVDVTVLPPFPFGEVTEVPVLVVSPALEVSVPAAKTEVMEVRRRAVESFMLD